MSASIYISMYMHFSMTDKCISLKLGSPLCVIYVMFLSVLLLYMSAVEGDSLLKSC